MSGPSPGMWGPKKTGGGLESFAFVFSVGFLCLVLLLIAFCTGSYCERQTTTQPTTKEADMRFEDTKAGKKYKALNQAAVAITRARENHKKAVERAEKQRDEQVAAAIAEAAQHDLTQAEIDEAVAEIESSKAAD